MIDGSNNAMSIYTNGNNDLRNKIFQYRHKYILFKSESDMYLKDKLFKKKGETWKKGEGILKRGGVYAISWREFTTW